MRDNLKARGPRLCGLSPKMDSSGRVPHWCGRCQTNGPRGAHCRASAEPSSSSSSSATDGSGSYEYTIRPLVPNDKAEQDAIYQMYLDNYDAYTTFACGVGDCRCAELGEGIKRYTRLYATDMLAITASHIDPGGQFWVVEATPTRGGAAEYAGCIGARRHSGKIMELHRVSVSPAHRRKALASRLVSTVEAWSRQSGFEAMFLTTWTPKVRDPTALCPCARAWLVARASGRALPAPP